MANELVVIEQATALDLFTAPEKVNQMLAHIKTLAEEERATLDSDLSIAKNRKAIASLAYKVAQTKTYIDKEGKAVVDKLKELPKKVDANRKQFRDELDALSTDIRQPLTTWEAEQERIETENQMLAWHEEALKMNSEFDKALAERIESDHEIALLMNEKFDRDLAEAKAEAERQRLAHEEQLKRQARLESERKAQQEIEAAAQREREAKEAQERAEREKQEAIQRAELAAKEAQERAENEKQLAIEAERKKAQEAEQARLAQAERQRQEEAKRQADTTHRKLINNQAMQDLIDAGIPEECAKNCIIAIAKNLVSNVKIHY